MGKKRTGASSKRKGKKLWRKVDTVDIEDKITLQGRPDSELFTIDVPNKKTEEKPRTKAEKREKIKNTPLFHEKILPTISKEKNPQQIRLEKLRTEKLAKQLKKKLEKSELVVEQKPKERRAQDFELFDIWDEKIVVPKKAKKIQSNIRENILPSKLTQVEAGQSYHPDKASHQKLLKKALDQVTETLDEEAFYEAQLKKTGPATPDVEVKWNYSDSETEEEETEKKPLDPEQEKLKQLSKHYSLKLTKTQRNALRKKRLSLLERKRQSMIERRNGNIEKIDEIIESINKSIEKDAEKLKEKEKFREMVANNPKKLGKLKFEEKPVDFKYSDELSSSLRKLKPSAAIPLDIMKNFERRNMVEPRKPAAGKYRVVKYVETRSAKNFNIELGI